MQTVPQRTNFRLYNFPELPAAGPQPLDSHSDVLTGSESTPPRWEVTEWKAAGDSSPSFLFGPLSLADLLAHGEATREAKGAKRRVKFVQKTFNPVTWKTVVPVPLSPPHPSQSSTRKEPMYHCPVPGCDKKYRRRCRAVEHVKLRHNPEGVARFQCAEDNCVKSYCRLDALRMHHRMDKHHGVKLQFEPNNGVNLAALEDNEPMKKKLNESEDMKVELPAETVTDRSDDCDMSRVEPMDVSTSFLSQEHPEKPESDSSTSPSHPISEPTSIPETSTTPPQPNDPAPTTSPSPPPAKVLPPLRDFKPVFRIIESDALRFRCTVPDCGKSYASRYRLSIHMVETHAVSSERPFLCPVQACRRAYATRESLKRHKRAQGHFEDSEPHESVKLEVEKPPEKKPEPGTVPNLEERVQELVDLFDEIK